LAEHRWVVLDTDVWSVLFTRRDSRTHPGAARWRDLLRGWAVAIATQTRAEFLVGVEQGGLGPDRRAAILHQLDRTPTVPVSEDVVQSYARLTAECRRQGHGLHDKRHTGDRWVASTAIAIGAPLLANDRIYQGAPSLVLLDAQEEARD
jgi:predicted nucleic acid-binding protein